MLQQTPQGAVDEYSLQAQLTQPLPTEPNSPVEPWRCLTACDDASAACAGVFLTKPSGSWSCWPLKNVAADSTGGVKLALGQLDTYLWEKPHQAQPSAGAVTLPVSCRLITYL